MYWIPNSQAQRKHCQLCLSALLQILAIPRKYAHLLKFYQLFLPIAFDQPEIKDKEITQLLARQGLTTMVANDTWQFCYNYLIIC
jgi:hypothetical protein